MNSASTGSFTTDEDVVALIEPLRRVAAARLSNRHDVDDVVQEALTRVISARKRLDDAALLAYAIVVVRNLIASHHRDRDRARQNASRLIDLTTPVRPEEHLLGEEERVAVGEALQRLPPEQREDLVAHVVDGHPLTDVSSRRQVSAGATAAQLARTRARMRLDYVLAMRRVQLPTAQCRPVLLALSAGDRRRQESLGAARHLLGCPTCADVSTPLLARERALAGVVPVAGVGLVWDRLMALLHRPTFQLATAGAVSATAVAVGVTVFGSPDGDRTRDAGPEPQVSATQAASPSGASSTEFTLIAGGESLLPVPADLRRFAGQPVRGRDVRVLAVPADEGFWVGRGRSGRVWVQLVGGDGSESDRTISPEDKVSFRGTMVGHGPGFPEQVGVSVDEGSRRLTRQRAHIEVSRAKLDLSAR